MSKTKVSAGLRVKGSENQKYFIAQVLRSWPSTDLDLDLSLTKIVNEDKAVVVILFKDVELILALLWLKVNGLMLTVDSKIVFMEGKKNFKLILPKL